MADSDLEAQDIADFDQSLAHTKRLFDLLCAAYVDNRERHVADGVRWELSAVGLARHLEQTWPHDALASMLAYVVADRIHGDRR